MAGPPGSGKSTLARGLAAATGATWLRIDTIEWALRASTLAIGRAEDAGHLAARDVARDNLALGRDIVADAVNESAEWRDWWASVARDLGSSVVGVEVTCSDVALHRTRVEARHAADARTPDWSRVVARPWEPWPEADIHVDTSKPDALDHLIEAFGRA